MLDSGLDVVVAALLSLRTIFDISVMPHSARVFRSSLESSRRGPSNRSSLGGGTTLTAICQRNSTWKRRHLIIRNNRRNSSRPFDKNHRNSTLPRSKLAFCFENFREKCPTLLRKCSQFQQSTVNIVPLCVGDRETDENGRALRRFRLGRREGSWRHSGWADRPQGDGWYCRMNRLVCERADGSTDPARPGVKGSAFFPPRETRRRTLARRRTAPVI